MADKSLESKRRETKTAHNYIFSKENVNMGHQSEFDYLKTFNILTMVSIHIYVNYSRDFFFEIIDFLSFILGAGGFMMLMGIAMKYSRHQESSYYISRGILLLTQGQCVNLIRNALPSLIAWWTTGNKIFISRALLFLQTDIFIFAGISFFLLALLKKMKLSDRFIMNIGIIMNIAAFLLYKIMKPLKSFLLSQLLGFFVLTNAEAYFPFCSYFIFVAIGYWLGGIYQKISNKDKFYNNILIVCLPIVTIYYYLRMNYNFPMFPECGYNEHYCLFPGPDAIATCLVNLIALALFYKIDMFLKGNTPYFVKHSGKNLNQYYMIHYTLIMQINTFLRATKGDDFPSKMKYPFLFAIFITFLCKIIIDMNHKYIHFTITHLKNPSKNIVFSIIWIMTIICVIYIYPKVETYTTFWNNYLYEN